MRRAVAAALVLLAAARAGAADERVERLARLGKLWGQVAFFHPWLRTRDIDWDGALVRAIPRVRAATSEEAFRAAVGSMLAELHDPATHLSPPAAPTTPSARPALRPLDGGVLLLDLGAPPVDAAAEIAKARAVVLDLRDSHATQEQLDAIAAPLLSHPGRGLAQREVEHRGYRSQRPGLSGYEVAVVSEPETYRPAPGATPRRVVFLVNAVSKLPDVAFALQDAGDGTIVSEGPLAEESVVGQQPYELGGGWSALIRTADLISPDGSAGIAADVVVRGDGLETALRVARRGATRARRARVPLPPFVWRPDRVYHEAEVTPELRLLGLFRYWNVVRSFYGYPELLVDWDAQLPRMIPIIEAARDADGYALALTQLAMLTADTHSRIVGPALDRLFGNASPPIAVRIIEGRPIVTALHGAAPGVSVGDEILSVDGEAAGARVERLAKVLPASNPSARLDKIGDIFTRGAEGQPAVLTLQGATGSPRRVELPRHKTKSPPERTGDVVRVLPDNIGYIDLDRLERAEVDAALEKVRNTRALILDMRGYPHVVFYALGSRMNRLKASVAARIVSRRVTAAEPQGADLIMQPIDPTETWVYQGPSVMLIDERTASQAEHTGLWLEAAAGTRFVGSQTAGANGGITTMTLPGELTAVMGGGNIRHADGRQLQQIGLVPDVEVRPTIRGIREGRDEVLERAVLLLSHD